MAKQIKIHNIYFHAVEVQKLRYTLSKTYTNFKSISDKIFAAAEVKTIKVYSY